MKTRPEFKPAVDVKCPRCFSRRVVESGRMPGESILYHTLGILPCRCAICFHRFMALRMPNWCRALRTH